MNKTIIRDNLRFVFFIFVFLVLAYSTLAQSGFRGTVVEVVDGKTVVIEMPTKSKVTTRIQFIEVPEPEQPFHGIVIEHLKKLVLGKQVTFKPRGITSTNSIVQLFVDGIDVGQQMLRDGAAWHAVPQMSGQDADERAIYQSTEKQAKAEKRGVWSKDDILPAWEFRVVREEQKKQEERARLEALKAKARKKVEPRRVQTNNDLPKYDARFGIEEWTSEIPYKGWEATEYKPVKGDFGLWYFHHYELNLGWVGTPLSSFNLFNGKEAEEIFFGAGYDYKGESIVKGRNVFAIGVGSLLKDQPVLANKKFTIEVDGDKPITLTKLKYNSVKVEEKHMEFLACIISREELTRLAESKNSTLVVGKYKRRIGKKIKDSFASLVSATAK